MHAFDFIMVLFSFVYAAAITHVLATAGDIIMAARRIRLSWLNAGWMLVALVSTISWWIGLWDMRETRAWDMPTVGALFAIAGGFYLFARLVCPRIPEAGTVDLQAFHLEEGRKYLVWFTLLAAVTVVSNIVLGQRPGAEEYPAQNITVLPMTVAAGLAAIFVRRRAVQVVCLVVELAMWAGYYGFQQSALAG